MEASSSSRVNSKTTESWSALASPAQSGSNEAKTEKISEVNSEKDSTKYSGKENLKSPSENLSEAGDSDLDDGQPQVLVEGITGFSSEYVILVSSDFHEFIVKRAVAYMSPTLKRILKMRNKTAKPRTVSEVLVNYPSLVVSKIVEYLIFKEYYELTHEDAPKFKVDPAIVLEVLLASQFLDI